MNTNDHPAIVETFAAKAALSKQFGPQALPFASQMRQFEAESRTQGIKFVDLSQKGPSAYAKRMASSPLPKNYWQRESVRPFIDPIEEELKATAKKAAKKKAAVRRPITYQPASLHESLVVREAPPSERPGRKS